MVQELHKILEEHEIAQKEAARKVKELLQKLTQEALQVGILRKMNPDELKPWELEKEAPNVLVAIETEKKYGRGFHYTGYLALTKDGELHRYFKNHYDYGHTDDNELGEELSAKEYLKHGELFVERLESWIERIKKLSSVGSGN